MKFATVCYVKDISWNIFGYVLCNEIQLKYHWDDSFPPYLKSSCHVQLAITLKQSKLQQIAYCSILVFWNLYLLHAPLSTGASHWIIQDCSWNDKTDLLQAHSESLVASLLIQVLPYFPIKSFGCATKLSFKSSSYTCMMTNGCKLGKLILNSTWPYYWIRLCSWCFSANKINVDKVLLSVISD